MKNKDLLDELRGLEPAEIQKKISGWKQELMNLRFRQVSQQLESPALIKSLKRSISRARTILREDAGIHSGMVNR